MNQPVRILYVDDHPLDRELVRDALEKEHGGFEVVEATSRAGFEARLAEGNYDLVLSDFNILGFEGLQVIDAVHAKNPRTPVVIVTGTGSEEIAVEAIKRGAADYVIKTPQHIQRLPHTIHAVLEKKRLEDEGRQVEALLRESETRFSTIFHASPAAIAMTRLADQQFVDANEAWQAMTGYTCAEAMGHTSLELNLWANPEQRQRLIETLRAQGTARDEMQIRRKSGEIGDVLMSAEFIELAGVQYLLTMAQDITERKQAEEAIQDSEERFRVVFENVFDGISIYSEDPDPSKRMLIECNEQYAVMAGRSREELLQLGSTLGLQITLEAKANDNRLESLVRQRAYRGSFSWIRPDGKKNVIEYAGIPITWRRKSYSIGIDRDITERKQFEETLTKERDLIRTLIDNLPDMIFVKDLESRFVLVNQASLQTGQQTMAEIIGKNDFEINPPELAARYYADDQAVIHSGQPIIDREERNISTGQTRWFSTTKAPLRDSKGQIIGLVGMSRDITERKQAEAQLTDQLDELRRWHEATLGRETRVLDLKHEVNELLRRLDEPVRYPSAEDL